jgi:hypothetical protein
MLDCEELGSSLKSVYPNSFSSDFEKFFILLSSDGLEINKTDFDRLIDRFSQRFKDLSLNAEELSLRLGYKMIYT